MKRFLMIVALVAGIFATVQAQTEKNYEQYPHWFIGLQGGGAMTINGEYNNFDQITPTASLSLGWYPIKEVAFRLSGNGVWSKSGICYYGLEDDNYAYKYVTGDIDALMNLCTIFGKKEHYPVNVFLVLGAGVNYMWDNAECVTKYNVAPVSTTYIHPELDNRTSVNGRAGLLVDVSLGKHWSINLEGDYNTWISKDPHRFVCDLKQVTAQIGLAYKFGYKKKAVVVEPEPEPYVAPAPTPAPVVEKKPEPKPAPAPEPKKLESIQENVFFTIGKSNAKGEEDAKITKAAEWMNAHSSATAVVTGYADKGTGSAAVNKKISEKRAYEVADKLKAAGVSADRITVDAKGDTVQPFAENDQNRVAIIVASEK